MHYQIQTLTYSVCIQGSKFPSPFFLFLYSLLTPFSQWTLLVVHLLSFVKASFLFSSIACETGLLLSILLSTLYVRHFIHPSYFSRTNFRLYLFYSLSASVLILVLQLLETIKNIITLFQPYIGGMSRDKKFTQIFLPNTLYPFFVLCKLC